jgi:hypothetical protein
MIYKKEDIRFDQISPSEFERLCYELLLKYNFTELTWRQGGADKGRDIEGSLYFENQLFPDKTKWFFECKRYAGGVSLDDLLTKTGWADVEKPDYLAFLTSSYITTAAKDWLEKKARDRSYKIVIVEGEELKERLLQFPDLIERFFSIGRYEKLFADIKEYWFGHNISPSFEVLKLLAEHLDPGSLTLNDLGFLFISLYKQYQYFEARNDFYGDFNTDIFSPFYDRLKELASLKKMPLFAEFKDDFSHLAGSGVIEDVGYMDDDDPPDLNDLYQYYAFHLNPGASRDYWAIGHYVFFKLDSGAAFEVFSLENSEFTTAAHYHPDFEMFELEKLTLEIPKDVEDAVRRYFVKTH